MFHQCFVADMLFVKYGFVACRSSGDCVILRRVSLYKLLVLFVIDYELKNCVNMMVLRAPVFYIPFRSEN